MILHRIRYIFCRSNAERLIRKVSGLICVLERLRARGITHVYIGQRQGRVNYAGPYVLKPAELMADARLRLVYRQDRVWVFEVTR